MLYIDFLHTRLLVVVDVDTASESYLKQTTNNYNEEYTSDRLNNFSTAKLIGFVER